MNYRFLEAMPPFLIAILLVAGFGVIVLIVILLKRHVSFFKDNEKPKSDKEIAAEELDHILQPIEEDLKPEGSDEDEVPPSDDAPKAE